MTLENLQELANRVCRNLPEGFVLSIELEHGSASVKLQSDTSDWTDIDLPDSTDKSLYEQVNDAIAVANVYTGN